MFAPWCPTCSGPVLLGPRRVEAVEAGPTGPRVVLRCFCDTLLVWSAASEGAPPQVVATEAREPGNLGAKTAQGAHPSTGEGLGGHLNLLSLNAEGTDRVHSAHGQG